ncbi:MAG TPA: methionyl-tRNA formyltransferase [Bacteroidia bacterium]|jgi:methionyl-tRNA formyltransferase|nr:methionyl-tRNA formyltransferase [Bacteroidia bacterium]
MRIVFMGTPDFAVESLDILVQHNYNIVGVITAPDKPAGRGQQLQQSAVKQYAVAKGLHILQPEKLKNPDFIKELQALKADLQIVVAFRMLPEVVWSMPRLGTFNLHGSLLPQYRGAAPINRAVMNGETETGVSTFFLQQEIDTGKIIFRETTSVGENETAGEVHDRLMKIGANLVLKTVRAIEQGSYPQVDQASLIDVSKGIKEAPKLFKEDCKVDWDQDMDAIHNQIRGLSPYPTAFTTLVTPAGQSYAVKLFISEKEKAAVNSPLKTIVTDGKTYLKIPVNGGFLHLKELQLAGKKRMNVPDFLRGFPITEEWRVV